MLMCESTNAERPGYTPSERKVGQSLEYIFTTHSDKRVVIATFSSNVHRVQQVIDLSAKYGRKVAVMGRSMLNIVGAATELGYMTFPKNTIIDISEIKKYNPEQLTIITTGSQGEPMSALYRMAFSERTPVTLGSNDVVVLSSSPIPGNEKLIGRIINELCRKGVNVLHDADAGLHVSGHACQEELKLMQALTKPLFFMPIHGEYRHLAANKALAESLGIDPCRIFISDIGKVLEIDRKGARFAGTVPAGRVMVDGYGVGDVGNIVLRDRRHLAEDGLLMIVAAIDFMSRMIISGPDIVSRGFVYVKESEELMDDVKRLAVNIIEEYLGAWGDIDEMQIKARLKEEISKYLFNETHRNPMVLPVII